jgi:hypothetical protein
MVGIDSGGRGRPIFAALDFDPARHCLDIALRSNSMT